MKKRKTQDTSVLGHSVNVSVKGVKQLLQAVNKGTDNNLLFNECSLIYECKVCRNLFRSVANFVTHKERFCQKAYNCHVADDDVDDKDDHHGTQSQSPVSCNLEPLTNSRHAVYQAIVPPGDTALLQSIGDQIVELNEEAQIIEAVLLRDGTAVPSKHGQVIASLTCSICSEVLPSKQALNNHISLLHKSRTCYSCPLCKLLLSSPFSVYRHLSKRHAKTEEQIRRLRPTILARSVQRELYQYDKQSGESSLQDVKHVASRSEEEKWNAQFESKLQCGICSKSFSRRAVLDFHAATCKPPVNPTPPSFCCIKCGRKFNRRTVLTAHSTSCTGLRNQSPLRAHTCNYCGLAFPRRRPLTLHVSRCPSRIGSPTKSLMSSQRMPPRNNGLSPSVIQIRRDYDKTPTKSNTQRILRGPPSKLDAVVRRLINNPMTPHLVNLGCDMQKKSKQSCNSNPPIVENKRSTNCRADSPVKSGNTFVSQTHPLECLQSSKMATLGEVDQRTVKAITPELKSGYSLSNGMNINCINLNAFPMLRRLDDNNYFKTAKASKYCSSNTFQNCNSSTNLQHKKISVDSTKEHEKCNTGLFSTSLSDPAEFAAPGKRVLNPSPQPTDVDMLSCNHGSTQSSSPSPIIFAEDLHLETDSDAVSFASRDCDRSSEASSRGETPPVVDFPFPSLNGSCRYKVSDDCSLTTRLDFVGFDAADITNNENISILQALITKLSSDLDLINDNISDSLFAGAL